MIKIAVISSYESLKYDFCRKICDECIEHGEKAAVLPDTTKISPFTGVDNIEEHVLWSYSSLLLNELESLPNYSVAITPCCAIEPFSYASINNVRTNQLLRLSHAACLWMETYDTIIFIKNGYAYREGDFDRQYYAKLEEEYCRVVEELLSNDLPVSIFEAKNVINEEREMLWWTSLFLI